MEEVRVVRFNSTTLTAPEPEKSKNESLFSDPDFGLFYGLCFIISIMTFIMDLSMHCWLAYVYHTKKELYFLLTVAFIIIPSIVSTGFSMRWYILDEDDELSPAQPSLRKWSVRIVTLLLQVTQIHRYFDALMYGLRSSVAGYRKQRVKQDHLYRKMLDEDCDAALLRLFYCVLNSAPQSVLQLTILLLYKMPESEYNDSYKKVTFVDRSNYYLFEYQCVSISISIFSVAWSLTAYDRTVRYIRDDKNRLSCIGTVLNFLSHFTWTVSRVFALAVFTTLYPRLALLGLGLHSTLMSGWLLYKQDVNHNRCDECVLDCMLGIAYIFIFISSHSGPQRYSYYWYYLICFAENIGCLFVWYQNRGRSNYELYLVLIAIQVSSFFFSLFFLLLYYKCFHPNRKYRVTQQYEMAETNCDKSSC